MLSYTETREAKAELVNTVPTYALYLASLAARPLAASGSSALHQAALLRAQTIYSAILASGGLYSCPVQPAHRSLATLSFSVPASLKNAFYAAASEAGFLLDTSTPTVCVSNSPGVSQENAQAFARFLGEFQARHAPATRRAKLCVREGLRVL